MFFRSNSCSLHDAGENSWNRHSYFLLKRTSFNGQVEPFSGQGLLQAKSPKGILQGILSYIFMVIGSSSGASTVGFGAGLTGGAGRAGGLGTGGPGGLGGGLFTGVAVLSSIRIAFACASGLTIAVACPVGLGIGGLGGA
jgi:hypothetical protein